MVRKPAQLSKACGSASLTNNDDSKKSVIKKLKEKMVAARVGIHWENARKKRAGQIVADQKDEEKCEEKARENYADQIDEEKCEEKAEKKTRQNEADQIAADQKDEETQVEEQVNHFSQI